MRLITFTSGPLKGTKQWAADNVPHILCTEYSAEGPKLHRYLIDGTDTIYDGVVAVGVDLPPEV